MRYLKYVAALLAYLVTDSFWGGLAGYFFGSWAVNRYLGTPAGMFGVNAQQRQQRQAVFLETLFLLMGKLAKADGRVSESEIKHAEHIFTQLDLNADSRKKAIEVFKRGTNSDFELNEQLDHFTRVCGRATNLKQLLVMYLVNIAMADGDFGDAEEGLLRDISLGLGFTRDSFERLLRMIKAQSEFSGRRRQQYEADSKSSLAAAYEVLGLESSATDGELKKSYRRQIRENHPDRLIGQGLPEDMVKIATERSQELQSAYDLIKKERGIR